MKIKFTELKSRYTIFSKNMVSWICGKCNLVWRYPLPQCPYCFSSLEKRIGKKEQVVKQVETNIASKKNFKVPYVVQIIEDEFGQNYARKLAQDSDTINDEVFLANYKYDFEEIFRKIFKKFNLSIGKDESVLLVPEIDEKGTIYKGEVTNIHLLEEAVLFLKKNGFSNITLGFYVDEERGRKNLRKNGFLELTERAEVSSFFITKNNSKKFDLAITFPVMSYSGEGNKPAQEFWDKLLTTGLQFKQVLHVGDATIGQREKQAGFFNLILSSFHSDSLDQQFLKFIKESK